MSDLRQHDGAGARALELLILCASRPNEVLKAPWSEFKLEERLWVIPKDRMKDKKREHRVPLSDAALAILRNQEAIRTNVYVFAGRDNRPADKGTLDRVLKRRLGRSEVTVHGFRSTFRDWGADETGLPREIIEMALAHRVAGATEGAYWRSDVVKKRRALAEAWAAYCAGGEVIHFPGAVVSADEVRQDCDDNDPSIDKSKAFLPQPSQGSAYMHHCQTEMVGDLTLRKRQGKALTRDRLMVSQSIVNSQQERRHARACIETCQRDDVLVLAWDNLRPDSKQSQK